MPRNPNYTTHYSPYQVIDAEGYNIGYAAYLEVRQRLGYDILNETFVKQDYYKRIKAKLCMIRADERYQILVKSVYRYLTLASHTSQKTKKNFIFNFFKRHPMEVRSYLTCVLMNNERYDAHTVCELLDIPIYYFMPAAYNALYQILCEESHG